MTFQGVACCESAVSCPSWARTRTLLIQSAKTATLQRLTKRTRTARSCRPSVVSCRAGCSSLSEFVRPRSLLNHQQWRWPMTREEFRAKWTARRAEWDKMGVMLNGAKICEEFIADFEDVLTSHDEAVVNTNQA